jgi:ankyrin repeat protein
MSVESIIVKMGNNPSQSEKLSNLIESSDLVSTVKLLQNGADPNELSSTGKSCLRLALEKGDSSLFRIFHSMGGSLIPPLTGESMMHFAVRSGHAKLVRHFLRNPSIFHGLKNQKDCQGRTPLHLAALDGNAEIVAMLLKYNANKDVLDDQGKTPRELALRKHGNQCDEVLELLGSEEIIVKSPNPGKDGLGLTDHAHNRRDSSRSTFFSYSCEPETKLDSLEQALKDSRIPTISSQDLTFDQTISRGSSCVVYSGSWLGTRVAIKQFKLEYSTSSKETKKFIKEMQILAQTRHPNLILIMGVCIDKPNLCIISELVPHCSLFQALHKFQKPLHLEARFKISIQIAQGLTYLHSNVPPIVHRDLKPENCLV